MRERSHRDFLHKHACISQQTRTMMILHFVSLDCEASWSRPEGLPCNWWAAIINFYIYRRERARPFSGDCDIASRPWCRSSSSASIGTWVTVAVGHARAARFAWTRKFCMTHGHGGAVEQPRARGLHMQARTASPTWPGTPRGVLPTYR